MRKPNLITYDPKHRLVGSSGQAEQGEGAGTEAYEASVRRLTPGEVDDLRRDMAEASAWARTELRKRRAAKNGKIS
ncbi:hypothetical protein COR21_17610 [Vibrio cholerae]|nr:hypothetical protein [Vibrio cholerae]